MVLRTIVEPRWRAGRSGDRPARGCRIPAASATPLPNCPQSGAIDPARHNLSDQIPCQRAYARPRGRLSALPCRSRRWLPDRRAATRSGAFHRAAVTGGAHPRLLSDVADDGRRYPASLGDGAACWSRQMRQHLNFFSSFSVLHSILVAVLRREREPLHAGPERPRRNVSLTS